MFLIQDEFQPSTEERLYFQRMRMRLTFVGGLKKSWAIGERFDDRFDTEVGGTMLVVTQGIDVDGNITGGLNTSMDGFAATPKMPRPAVIVDYNNRGLIMTAEEAELNPEYSAVLARLKERMAEFASITGEGNVNYGIDHD